nr:MFS transporter [Brevibacillus fulvus]
MLITFAFWFSHYVYLPMLAPYLKERGANYAYVGLVLASYGVLQVLLRLPLGIVSDFKQIRLPFVRWGVFAGMVSALGFAVTDGLGWSLVWRTLAGLSAATWVVFTVTYLSHYQKEEAAKAMGMIQFVSVLSQLLAMVASGYLVDLWGWRSVFVAGAGIGAIGFVLTLAERDRQARSERPVDISQLAGVLKEQRLIRLSWLTLLAHCILFSTIYGFLPAYALSLGCGESAVSYLVVSFMVPHAISSILTASTIVPRLGTWGTLIGGFLGSALSLLLIPLGPHLLWLCLTQLLNGFALGMVLPLLMGMVGQTVSAEKRATAMGFFQTLLAIGIFSGPFLAGGFNHLYGLFGGFVFAGLVGLLGAGLAIQWRFRDSSLSKVNRK